MPLGLSEMRQYYRKFDTESITISINERLLRKKVHSRKFVAREVPASYEAEEQKSQNAPKTTNFRLYPAYCGGSYRKTLDFPEISENQKF